MARKHLVRSHDYHAVERAAREADDALRRAHAITEASRGARERTRALIEQGEYWIRLSYGKPVAASTPRHYAEALAGWRRRGVK
jgi:hypothetical protein